MNRPATLERGSFHDESMNSGNQSTDMSMIHRRCYTLVVASLDRTRRKQRSTIDYCGHMSRLLKNYCATLIRACAVLTILMYSLCTLRLLRS
jgi:hypothetical protein